MSESMGDYVGRRMEEKWRERIAKQDAGDTAIVLAELTAGSKISVRLAPHRGWYVADIDTGVILGSSTGETFLDAMANVVRAFGVTQSTLVP